MQKRFCGVSHARRTVSFSIPVARNRYLVDNADMLLAAYDGQPGGTEMTIRYARQMGIQVCCIKPVIQDGNKKRPGAKIAPGLAVKRRKMPMRLAL